jgi:4-carboxymuconolactone decarboxylase
MTPSQPPDATLGASGVRLAALDVPTAALIRLAARVTAGDETAVRDGFAECAAAATPDAWVEELILQSYLFAGFPRALNAAREWRRQQEAAGGTGPAGAGEPTTYEQAFDWRLRGEATCAVVYGEMYEKLRGNIRRLHPALDEWMIVEGYGKVLSRPGLDLPRRDDAEFAACIAARQDRQLHSHLHGAVNAGAAPAAIDAVLVAVRDVVPDGAIVSATLLWNRVKGK